MPAQTRPTHPAARGPQALQPVIGLAPFSLWINRASKQAHRSCPRITDQPARPLGRAKQSGMLATKRETSGQEGSPPRCGPVITSH